MKGGERLVENELRRSLGVSRAPIRESFRILERDGFITRVPRKGTFVRKITKKDIEENFLIRASLESLAAKLAIPHLSSGDITEIKEAFEGMKKTAEDNDFKSHLKYHSCPSSCWTGARKFEDISPTTCSLFFLTDYSFFCIFNPLSKDWI